MDAEPVPALSVHVERGRRALRVIASSDDPAASLRVDAVFSGGPDGMWFRLTQAGASRVFSRDTVARHPALSAVLRLIADEVDANSIPARAPQPALSPRARAPQPALSPRALSQDLLPFLFRSLIVYARRMSLPVPLPRWGRPLRDSRVERALELLNRDIAKRWTVALLARAVGLSRPAFARQFLRVLGLSPMRYLTQKRMQAAAATLLGSDAALAEVAHQVGYRSEFAFNRAFKKQYGVPPGVYRQLQGTPVAGATISPVPPLSTRPMAHSGRPVALRMAA